MEKTIKHFRVLKTPHVTFTEETELWERQIEINFIFGSASIHTGTERMRITIEAAKILVEELKEIIHEIENPE